MGIYISVGLAHRFCYLLDIITKREAWLIFDPILGIISYNRKCNDVPLFHNSNILIQESRQVKLTIITKLIFIYHLIQKNHKIISTPNNKIFPYKLTIVLSTYISNNSLPIAKISVSQDLRMTSSDFEVIFLLFYFCPKI